MIWWMYKGHWECILSINIHDLWLIYSGQQKITRTNILKMGRSTGILAKGPAGRNYNERS